MVRRTFFDGNPKNWMPLGSFLDYNPHGLLLMKKKLAVWRDRYDLLTGTTSACRDF
jgi:hypothetical protein